jgi:hypothetical protein
VSRRRPASIWRLLHRPAQKILFSSVDPHELLRLRHYGREWRSAADWFLRLPNESNRHNAERALEIYAQQLRRLTRRQILQSMQVETLAGLVLTAGSGAADAVMVSLDKNVPIASVVQVLIVGFIATRYLIRSGGSEGAEKRLDLPRKTGIKSLQLPDPNPPTT